MEIQLKKISASKIKLFRTCERKYYYDYINKPERVPVNERSLAATVGSLVHRAIELRYKNGDTFNSVSYFQEQLTLSVEKMQNDGIDLKGDNWFTKSLKDGKDMLRKFDWNRFNPQDLEMYFSLPFPNKENPLVIMTGYIDLIDMSGAVVDHKSDNRQPNKLELEHNPQFLIYAWAYKEMYGDLPYEIFWNHLRLGKLIPVNVYHNYQFKLQQLIYDIQGLITRGDLIEDYPRRLMDEECRKRCAFFKECYGDAPVELEEDEE